MTASNDVTLRVGGKVYGSWTDIMIESSLTEISDAFTVSVTERWAGQQATYQIKPGDACSLAIGDTSVITGYVNDVAISYDDQSHTVTVRGRDKTGDLVDCSALVSGVGSWNGVSVMTIAKALLTPFGIGVTSTVADTDKVIAGHSIQMGETVWECLDRIFRQYGVMAIADGSGNLVLTRPGEGGALAELRLGSNILSAEASYSDRETFKDYYLLGQFPGTNDAYSDPRVTTGASAHASDSNVSRYRPLIVFTECNTADMSFLPTRAKWEAAHRSGRGRRFTVRTTGWRDANDSLILPNTMCRLEDDFLGVHETLLVTGVRLTFNDDGRLAELMLTRKDAFLPAPVTTLPPYENKGSAS